LGYVAKVRPCAGISTALSNCLFRATRRVA